VWVVIFACYLLISHNDSKARDTWILVEDLLHQPARHIFSVRAFCFAVSPLAKSEQ
jgi:hypothetical protein